MPEMPTLVSPYLNRRRRSLREICQDRVARGIWTPQPCEDCPFREICCAEAEAEVENDGDEPRRQASGDELNSAHV